MRHKKISVILPTYNEVTNIVPLLETLKKNLRDYTHEILVVDDNSVDGTYKAVKNFSKKNSNVRAFLHQGKPELGDSILQGINSATGTVIVGMDADFNHDPLVISKLIKKLEYCDLVVASRFVPGGGMTNRFRYYLSLAFNCILKYIFRFPILDNTSGFYAITTKKLLSLNIKNIYRGYGEYHLRLVKSAKNKGLTISEVPVMYGERLGGVSKSKFAKMFVTYLKVALQND